MTLDPEFEALRDEFTEQSLLLVAQVESKLMAIEEAVPEGGAPSGLWVEMLGALHTIKGNAGMMQYVGAQRLAHEMEALANRTRALDSDQQGNGIGVLLSCVDALLTVLQSPEDGAGAAANAIRAIAPYTQQSSPSVHPSRPAPGIRRPSRPPMRPQTPSATPAVERVSDIRIGAESLDRLLELVGELATDKARVASLVQSLNSDSAEEAVDKLGKTITEIRDRVMQDRLLPIAMVLGRFKRLVRDLSIANGKSTSFRVKGADTVVDKSIIDAIGQPLLHILQNAIDHGVETSRERLAAGKPAVATVTIEAAQSSNNLIVTISDDGRGISRHRLAQSAIKKGIDITDYTEEELLELIFFPELSTKTEVTQLSGRGLGMDAARRTVEQLGGAINVTSTEGRGTVFRIRVPLSATVTRSLLVQCGEETFALPIRSVVASMRLRPVEVHHIYESKVLRWRNRTIPLLDLADRLGLQSAPNPDAIPLCAVLEDEDLFCGLLVDGVCGQQELVVKRLDDSLGRPDCIAGAAVLGDGRVVMVIDPRSIVKSVRRVSTDREALVAS